MCSASELQVERRPRMTDSEETEHRGSTLAVSGGLEVTEILESTLAVSRGLEALQSEHEVLLKELRAEKKGNDTATEESQVAEHKETVLNESLESLREGINEAKLMVMLANYISSLEAEKQKHKAQVKRLCAENNWLRLELVNHQQLLQEAEVQLAKVREEKEHLDFLLRQSKEGGDRPPREQSPSMDIDIQEEEAEGVHVRRSSGVLAPGSSAADMRHQGEGGGGGQEYEIPENIKALHHLALQYVNQGKPEVAVPLCKKAVHELEQKKGRNNPDVASMLHVLAVIYREQGKLKDATKLLQETLEIREVVFGPDHAAVASTLNNLSVLHGKTGDFKAAEPYCKKALEIRQKLLGANHPDVAKQYTNLAILCSHLGKYDEVEYYYQRALEIYQTELGADDPNVAKTLSNLANCYLKQGKYRAAELIYKKVLATVQTHEATSVSDELCSPSQASWVISSSPESPSPRSKKGKEEAYHEKGGWHKSVPVQSPTVSSTLRSLSNVYREQGQLETAEELEKFTKEKVLDQAQQDRVAQLLEGGGERRTPSPSKNQQAVRRQPSRPALSQNIRKFLGLRSDTAEKLSQDSNS